MQDTLIGTWFFDGIVSWLFIMGAYCVGSIPCGYLIARLCGVADIREHGSGTIGATNVARILGKPFFALILFLDAAKAYGYTMLVMYYFGSEFWVVALCVMALLIGNSFPIFLNFRGGKGVSTAVGCMLALHPKILVVSFAVWAMALFCLKKVGYASVVVAFIVPGISHFYFHNHWTMSLLFLCMALLIIMRHSKNLKEYVKRVA